MPTETQNDAVAQETKTSTKKNNTLVIIIVIILGLLALCGILIPKLAGVAFKSYLGSKGLDVDTKNGDVTLKTEDGTLTFNGDDATGSIKTDQGELKYGENLSLPSDFPSDVPVYPGATIVSVSTKTEDNSAFVTFTTSQSVETVMAYYKNELPQKGWTFEAEYSGSMLSYTKDTRQVGIIFSSDSGKTSVVISTSTDN